MKKRVHFIGIGGAGLSALARIMLARGWQVSGSDRQASARTDALAEEGATIFIGHHGQSVEGADVVVMSSAIPADNPERIAAQATGIPLLKRDRWLARITEGYDLIGVSGTHGKTTTTSMISLMLLDAGLDPTVVIGAEVPQLVDKANLPSNARAGTSRFFVLEADEYDHAFLGLNPTISVVLNVEHDHPDIYPDEESVQEAFLQFIRQTRQHGAIVACTDDIGVQKLLTTYQNKFPSEQKLIDIMTYGLEERSEWQAIQLQRNAMGGTDFTALHHGKMIGTFSLSLPGQHLVRNALAAIAVGSRFGVELKSIQHTLHRFKGATRRFQPVGNVNGIDIFDDYAHHPTEIRVTLAAARQQFEKRPLWAIFEPHTFSRLNTLYDEFIGAFTEADQVIVSNVYAARSKEQGNVIEAGHILAQAIQNHGTNAIHQSTSDEIIRYVIDHIPDNGVVMTLGAGNITHVGPRLQQALQSKIN